MITPHFGYDRIVEIFDKDETAGSFLREDGEGGFASGVYRMAREIERLRGALEIIAGRKQCVDNLLSNADVARIALDSHRNLEKYGIMAQTPPRYGGRSVP